MRRATFPIAVAALVLALTLVATACGSGTDSASPRRSGRTATSTTTTTPSASGAGSGIVNVWSGPAVDRTRLPLGTSHVSRTAPAVGGLFTCSAGGPAGGPPGGPGGAGARVAGPWIDEAAGTWDATKKVSVQGRVAWPMARYDEQVGATTRTVSGNGLPVELVTGTFPIAANDPAHAYDGNPNRIAESTFSFTLPLEPTPAGTPACLGMGAIGVLRNGVVLYAPVDEQLRDAVAYETQDVCDGHPQQTSQYHYHDVPVCILDASTGPSTVVGFAFDGYPIVVERDANGRLPTNADLDVCHGRTSPVLLDGKVVTTYHYSATSEFPYSVGCYHGTKTA